MELLLSHFNLSRAYVFKLREDNSGYDELFEVCADNITYNTDMLNNGFSITERPNYERFFDDSQCFIANTKDLCEPLKSILEKQEITFLIQTAIIKNNKFRGFLGYDLCGRDTHLPKKDIYTLKNSGKMLAWFTLMQFERMKWCDKKQT